MNRSSLRNAALTCATRWHWPVLPGASLQPGGASEPPSCSCADPECVVPGAHPLDPVLLAATTDARMVDSWWSRRPDASVLLATGASAGGRRSPCALSLPAAAGRRALAEFDRLGVPLGPVVATPTRYALLVRPYAFAELGELLYAQDRVPSSLRFHGEGGYAVLPPSPAVTGGVRWVRRPTTAEPGADSAVELAPDTAAGQGADSREPAAPWLPRMETLLETLVEASVATPDTGSRLAY